MNRNLENVEAVTHTSSFIKGKIRRDAIIAFMIGIVIASSIAVYAVAINANQVAYTNNKKVSDALNELYTQVPNGTKTITEKSNSIDVSKFQYADTTGLYTLSELQEQTGKGIYWNSGNFKMGGPNSTFTIQVGFVPVRTVVYIYVNDSTRAVLVKEGTEQNEFNSGIATGIQSWSGTWDNFLTFDYDTKTFTGSYNLDGTWTNADVYWVSYK